MDNIQIAINDIIIPTQLIFSNFSLKTINPIITETAIIPRLFIPNTIEPSIFSPIEFL